MTVEIQSTWWKTSQSRTENQKTQSTHSADTRIEPRPHWINPIGSHFKETAKFNFSSRTWAWTVFFAKCIEIAILFYQIVSFWFVALEFWIGKMGFGSLGRLNYELGQEVKMEIKIYSVSVWLWVNNRVSSTPSFCLPDLVKAAQPQPLRDNLVLWYSTKCKDKC